MAEPDNVRCVEEIYGAFARGDVPAVLDQLDDDVDWYDPGPAEVSHAGRYRGREDVGRFFSLLGETLDFEAFEPREFLADGDRVVVLGSMRATVKRTGRSFENEWAMVWRFERGKVARWQVYEDTARELEAHTGPSAAAGRRPSRSRATPAGRRPRATSRRAARRPARAPP